jgi:hypothetical protein
MSKIKTPTDYADVAVREILAVARNRKSTAREKYVALHGAICDLACAVRRLDERCKQLAMRPAGERRYGGPKR